MNTTCKDCIHYPVCADRNPGMVDAFGEDSTLEPDGLCKQFKDKSRFIELPCAVGDTLWVLWSLTPSHPKSVYPVKAYALRYDDKKNNMRVCVRGEFKRDNYGGYYHHYYRGTFSWDNVGKTVFLTKKEAEKALKGGTE